MIVSVWLEKIYFSIDLFLLHVVVGRVVYLIALRILKTENEEDIELILSLGGARAASTTDVLKRVLT